MDTRIALTGFGNVGQGLAELLARDGDEYARSYGVRLLLSGVTDRGGMVVAPAGIDLPEVLEAKRAAGTVAAAAGGGATSGPAEFLAAAEADVLVEAASTNFDDAEPGWSYARTALSHGTDVVFASKGALVLHFDRITSVARESDARVRYTATVGAPLPVLELPERVLIGVHIEAFQGIVNATTNQILTTMAGGASYEEGVRAAQEAGVAETDPTLDVDGWDAAAKAVIIGRSVFGGSLELADVDRTGIRGVTLQDLHEARSRGNTIKLIVRIDRSGDSIRARVAPEERSAGEVLGNVSGQQMGLIYTTSELGDVAATVQLTGGVPTALAVLRDVINLARERAWTKRQ